MTNPTKHCRYCDTTLPLSEFFKNKKLKDGYEHRCKSCCKAYRLKLASCAPDPEKIMKRCSRCDLMKQGTEFYRNSSTSDGVTVWCRECNKESARQWNETNPERHQERLRAWRAANKEYRQAYKRARRAIDARQQRERYWALPAKERARERERRREVHRKWRMQNPRYYNEHSRRRNAIKRAREVAKVSYARIIARDGYICHICNGLVSPTAVHFDHVIPLARGGAHTEENIKVSHAECNLRKGARLMSEIDFV